MQQVFVDLLAAYDFVTALYFLAPMEWTPTRYYVPMYHFSVHRFTFYLLNKRKVLKSLGFFAMLFSVLAGQKLKLAIF